MDSKRRIKGCIYFVWTILSITPTHVWADLYINFSHDITGPVFSYKLRYIVGFWLVEMAISTNPKPTIYRNLYENTAPHMLEFLRYNIVRSGYID